MNIAVTERYVGDIPTGADFDQWVANLLAYKVEHWGLTDQDYTKIGEQFGMPGNALWYLPEGNYRLMNAPVSVIGLEAALCDYVNLYVYSVLDDVALYDKMIIMEYGNKRLVKYHDGSDTWHDMTNVGTDGADVVQFDVSKTQPVEKDKIWVDIRGVDPDFVEPEFPVDSKVYSQWGIDAISDDILVDSDGVPSAFVEAGELPVTKGVITLRVWNKDVQAWETYYHHSVMTQDVYDPNHKGSKADPFKAADDSISEFLTQYQELLKHAQNKLHLVHVNNADRENYNTTKIYRPELNEWVDVGGKLYEEMVEFIKVTSDEVTHATDAEDMMDDAKIEYEAHVTDDYHYRAKMMTGNDGEVLATDEGEILSFEAESHTHHLTREEAERYEAKADPDHTHDSKTVEIESEKIMDRFIFDDINSSTLSGQTYTPRAIAYGNGRLIILGYGSDDIFISDDGGFTWTAIKNTAGAKNYVHLEYDESQKAWFGVADDMALSTIVSYDNGLTWEETDPLIYTAPQYVQYSGRYAKIQTGVIYQSMNAFNWYPKTLKDISQGTFDADAIATAVVYSPKYPGVIVIVNDATGASHICTVDLRNCGIKNMVPEVYDRTVKIQSLAMFNFAPTKKGVFYYGEDVIFTDADGQEYAKRMYFHNGNTIYMQNTDYDLEVYKIVDATQLGTPSYRDALMLVISLKDLHNWESIENKPTTLAGYGIDPDAEQIVTQLEWEAAKTKADSLTSMNTTVYGWTSKEINPTDIIRYAVDSTKGVYFHNDTEATETLIQIGGSEPYQMGALSANDNVDFPVDVTSYILTADHPITCQVNGYTVQFTRKDDEGIVFTVADTSEVLKSVKSIRSNLEDKTESLEVVQHNEAKALVTQGLALEHQIPVQGGKFTVLDVCFNSLTHKFMAAGIYSPNGEATSCSAVVMSDDALNWSNVVIVSPKPSRVVRIGCFRNVSYGYYVVTTENHIWVSEDGINWDIASTSTETLYPVVNLSINDKTYVFRAGELSYHIVYAIESRSMIEAENTPWGNKTVLNGCVVGNSLYALVLDTDGSLVLYYQTETGFNKPWESVKISDGFDANRIFYDVHKKMLYITKLTSDAVLYCEDLTDLTNWKIAMPRKKCRMEALFSGSNTQLYVNIAQNYGIAPSCYFSNEKVENCPITMTGTIEDELFETGSADSLNQRFVAGCYGDGIFVVFAMTRMVNNPEVSTNYTIFYVNDNTEGRFKTANIIPDTTMIE